MNESIIHLRLLMPPIQWKSISIKVKPVKNFLEFRLQIMEYYKDIACTLANISV